MIVMHSTSLYSVRGAPPQTTDQAVLDAPPGERVFLLRARGASANAFCPRVLGGACVDLGYPSLVGSAMTLPNGAAAYSRAIYASPQRGFVRRYVQATTINGVKSPPLAGYTP
jgi:hypothetical protein